jgi:6-phosphogluconate dehydrogenase
VTPGRAGLSRTAEEGYLYCGSHGAGHFVKMVHNGIEYGMMQSLAEGFDLLYHADKFGYELPLPDIAEVWRRGSVISSWLLDLTATVEGRVADSGEGRWTVESAVEAGVPCPAMTMAVYTRFQSQASRSFAEKMLSAMRMAFGGHVESHELHVK